MNEKASRRVLQIHPVRRLLQMAALGLGVAVAQVAYVAEPVRQSFDMRVPEPPTPVTIDGTQRLIYELHLNSFARETLVLRKLDVIGAAGKTVVAEIEGTALAMRIGKIAASSEQNALAIVPGATAVIYLELAPGEGGDMPQALKHRLEFAAAGTDTFASVEGGRVTVRTTPPVVLGPPLAGGPWAAIHHPAWLRGHRRVVYAVDGQAHIPGRYAIDWFKLDAVGRRTDGDSNVAANWYGHGAPVLAVADATVVAARDDIDESATLSERSRPALGDATGNYVALDLGDGRYAFYEHLEPGSIRVNSGQRVARGEQLGAVGFTGSSTGPHLHFHVADANSPLGAEGQPFVIDRFTVLGRYESLDTFGDAPWQPLGDAADGQRRNERPAPNVVIQFPD